MSQNGNKVEIEIEVKAPAAKFHQVFSCKPHIMASMSPQSIQGCDLLEGEWGKPGCIICWRYSHDGSPQIAKEIIEAIDNENYITNYKVIGGNLLELYKSFSSTVKVTPKENDDGSLVHWIFEYEKLKEDVPDPTGKLQILIDVAKDIDAHLLSQQP
ncbi:MLP-like protein 34 [Citrus sinensis]|uniref:Bet v I/Major latex protein domain-containing protein n=1 Tax=Citrus clementina TaxID=85681 RepID=V4W5T3_CITCL|nr:MLP-like protein 43 [Citrus sinensis]ESR61439.1 hypothetical protein CICLE_v10017039mg [Citrus x clementina]KAH9746243.1 MLP-like protein 34 [Citrus sinensis]GAY58924.1 hypothetical protein CUMW_190580 [Citrus unshiu]